MKRECGMLLPVSSLPSPYGIGCFSKEAYDFVDKLKEAGQQYWQILPLGPTCYGDSPYQSYSAFAGNPFFIDLVQLVEQGLLTKEECDAADFGDADLRYVNYDQQHAERFPLLRKAYVRWKESLKAMKFSDRDIRRFLDQELMPETKDYCFFMALKKEFKNAEWIQWDEDIRLRRPEALHAYGMKLAEEIEFYEFQQYQFMHQWQNLKKYANDNGIRIIGDIPIYVAFDGADSWAHPELFQFDEKNEPQAIAGCPPDAFSATGQLWGNPLYRWEYHKQTGYDWWLKRMTYSFKIYDMVRIDHFRGFDEYWSVPYGDKTAERGHWEKGPGIELFDAMKARFGKPDIIAEDLGFLTPSVYKLLEDTGYPGMKVLEFAFDDSHDSTYLPHKYEANSVVYTGTHDNTTVQAWYAELEPEIVEFTKDYLGNERTPQGEVHWDFIRLAMGSVARLAVIPVQDYLGLGAWARVNEPGTVGKNWKWRMTAEQMTPELLAKVKKMAQTYGRCPYVKPVKVEDKAAIKAENVAVKAEDKEN